MRFLVVIILAYSMLSCGSDSITFPKSYTFSHIEEFPEGLFWLTTPTNPASLEINTGTYGLYRNQWKSESAEIIKQIFDLQEIELLSESSVRIRIKIDEEVIDTIVDYSKNDEEIIIDALEDSDIIMYDKEADQFVVCGFTTIAFPGPNVQNPGSLYFAGTIEDCLEDGGLNEHIAYVLSKNSYMALDTIGIFITKYIFK